MKACEIAILSVQDVFHEWRMSFCVMFAVAAIATPLLLFFGLKSGVMKTLENRLLSNPSTVEIISMSDRKLDDNWFKEQREDPKVSFVIPRTRRLAASAEFTKTGDSKNPKKTLDLYPSATGDPLLEHYRQKAPSENECVLSQEAFRRIGANIGDTVKAVVTRDRGTSKVEREFLVVGVLPDAAGSVACAYITLEELEEIEAFKDGIAVPKRQWQGSESVAYPVIPEVLIILPEYLDAVREAMLIQNTGFSRIKRLDSQELEALQPFISENKKGYLLGTVGNPASKHDLMTLCDRFRGRSDVSVIPFTNDLFVSIKGQPFKTRSLKAFKGMLNEELLSLDPTDFSETPAIRKIYMSKNLENTFKDSSLVCEAIYSQKTDSGEVIERKISFEVSVGFIDSLDDETVMLPIGLLSQLSLLQVREISDGVNNSGEKAFTLKRRGYTGFRMYASSLMDVVLLQEKLTKSGIKTSSRADRISEVLSLDKYLSLLFVLIAGASIFGATCCLIANVYANVERKRKELAILRLLGVNSFELGVFPLVGSITLTLGGIVLSLIIFYIFMNVINSMFSYQLNGDEKFCDLNVLQSLGAVVIACVIASISGLMASRRIMKIEPSESLRDE